MNAARFFIIFLLSVMLKFTVQFTSVHLFTCVAKAVTSQLSRECSIISSGCEVLLTSGRNRLDFYDRSLEITSDQ